MNVLRTRRFWFWLAAAFTLQLVVLAAAGLLLAAGLPDAERAALRAMFASAAPVLVYGALMRRRVLPLSLILWPAIAGLCCVVLPNILFASFHYAVIGKVHPLTIAFCGGTILMALASTLTFVQSVRWSQRPDRPRLLVRLFPTVCGIAFFALTLWLASNGWVGLRTWAW